MQDREFTFSVVIPVHRVERHLAEAVESVVGQSVGFEDTVQLILLNDGSLGDSEAICLGYVAKYPRNVVYLRQGSAGASAARNAGLEYATGRYVSFLDGDDKWALDAFERARDFFERHPEVDVAAAQIVFFGATGRTHRPDYRLGDDRVVDIRSEPGAPQPSLASAFIRLSAIGARRFDERLSHGEDFKFVTPAILDRGAYGLLASATYWCRRQEGDSAQDRSSRTPSWYLDTPKYCHEELFDYSKREFGEVLPYLQHCVMHDLRSRLRSRVKSVISDRDMVGYRDTVARLLVDISDAVILGQRDLNVEHRLWALALKRGVALAEVRSELRLEGSKVYLEGHEVRDLESGQRLDIEILERRGDSLLVEGSINSIFDQGDVCLYFRVAGQRLAVSPVARPDLRKRSLGEVIGEPIGFSVLVPLRDAQTITPVLRIKDFEFTPPPVYGPHARLTETMISSYFCDERLAVFRKGRKIGVRGAASPMWRAKREAKYLWELVSRKKRAGVAATRMLHVLVKPFFSGKRVWLISDRVLSAGDNGEAFFRYLMKQRPAGIRPYFALSPESADYARMQRTGPTVAHGGLLYRLLLLQSQFVISSAADGHVTMAFGADHAYFKNLQGFKFVFLQHGITKDDLSGWLNRYNKNIRVFVTAAKPEYDSIISGCYHYTAREVKLTGFPRHDRLLEADLPRDNKILLMPTWRMALSGAFDPATGRRSRFHAFRASEYFRFFNALINDARLQDALRTHDYSITFALHPSLAQEAGEFAANEFVTVKDKCDYDAEFKSARLLVTDYSSVAFDFALLDKPVIYAQFDRETFITSHTYEQGYFHYESDGFGPVCVNLDETVSAIIDALERGCIVDAEYARRAASFFYRGDQSNCENLFQELTSVRD